MKRFILTLSLLPLSAVASEDDIFLQGIAPEVEAADKQPIFVVPLQPVWNSADANLLLKVGKNLVTLIEEAGPWKVVFYDETKALRKVQDHEARLHKKWHLLLWMSNLLSMQLLGRDHHHCLANKRSMLY